MESEASHTEDSAGMVRPLWTNVPPQILALETYNKENMISQADHSECAWFCLLVDVKNNLCGEVNTTFKR